MIPRLDRRTDISKPMTGPIIKLLPLLSDYQQPSWPVGSLIWDYVPVGY